MDLNNIVASVRVSGPPNRHFLVGYTGISATMPRIEGTVEIRPSEGFSAPVAISFVRIALHRCETIHPAAESVPFTILSAPRRDLEDVIGEEIVLWSCSTGTTAQQFMVLDLPFRILLPSGSSTSGRNTSGPLPPATISLPSRIAETYYELVVTVQQGSRMQRSTRFPLPLLRYDTLSTFGMYNRPRPRRASTDNMVFLEISLPKSSYGPNDPIDVYIRITPNKEYANKAKKVLIDKITLSVEEEITFNPHTDEMSKKVTKIAKKQENIRTKLPEAGYMTSLSLVFPAKELRDQDGVIKPPKPGFPLYEVTSFTTQSQLYRIEFYLTIKATLTSARDITIREQIVVCPFDNQSCLKEIEAINESVKEASYVNNMDIRLRPTFVHPEDDNALAAFGLCKVGDAKKLYID